jgi:para-nitrobenzyl esterase
VKEIEADNSISPEAKKTILSKVLNGRWFSEGLDKHFGTASLWPE